MPQPTTIIGIDCAVQEKNLGFALGEFDGKQAVIAEVTSGRTQYAVLETIADWCDTANPILLTLDAPLGWPIELSQALNKHVAGQPINIEPDLMFRRETDRVVREKIGKQSLDVGADRIARTAVAALKLIDDLSKKIQRPIPLAWQPIGANDIAAIEVYPAGTLATYRINVPGYKKKDGHAARRKLIDKLKSYLIFPTDQKRVVQMEKNDDALDAAICILAGADFLRGDVLQPEDIALAKKEGWIWIKTPAGCSSTNSI